jgi:hypothetical protein
MHIGMGLWSSTVGLFDDKRKYFDKHCVMIRYVENRTRPLPSNLLLNLYYLSLPPCNPPERKWEEREREPELLSLHGSYYVADSASPTCCGNALFKLNWGVCR